MENGGRTWARTKDPLIKSQLLYQLSYASTPACRRAPSAGSAPYSGRFGQGKGLFATFQGLAKRAHERARGLLRVQFSTARIVPMQIMFVIIDEPPWLMNGSGMPTTGARPITIIRLMQT